jgi:hypothetical protein
MAKTEMSTAASLLLNVATVFALTLLLIACGSSSTTTTGGLTPSQQEFHVGCQGGNETYCN